MNQIALIRRYQHCPQDIQESERHPYFLENLQISCRRERGWKKKSFKTNLFADGVTMASFIVPFFTRLFCHLCDIFTRLAKVRLLAACSAYVGSCYSSTLTLAKPSEGGTVVIRRERSFSTLLHYAFNSAIKIAPRAMTLICGSKRLSDQMKICIFTSVSLKL